MLIENGSIALYDHPKTDDEPVRVQIVKGWVKRKTNFYRIRFLPAGNLSHATQEHLTVLDEDDE